MAHSPEAGKESIRHIIDDDQTSVVVGNPAKNFWIWSQEHGFDLTHPPTPESPLVYPRLALECSASPITIDPAKTALLIIDTQNFNMSQALVNTPSAFLEAEENILNYAIPAARKAQIQIIWLTWGLTEDDLDAMPPGVHRVFGWHAIAEQQNHDMPHGDHQKRSIVSRAELRTGKGLGTEIGKVTLADGSTVDGGRVLMRDTWNTQLHGGLEKAWQEGQKAPRPDVRFHKNRNSGMCDAMTACTEYLEKEGLKTLLFTGLNTDQCVMGTLQDANLKGFDTILLGDGSGTDSPHFAQQSAEYNCYRSWGFHTSCKELSRAADAMRIMA